MKRYDAAIIGGGAAGLFAAANLCEAGLSVILFEPNRFLGRKLRITGKGRCNLTNNCPPEEVLKNIPRNPKFLYAAMNKFPPERIMSWFEQRGVPLKTERGRRVFPKSDRAEDVAEAIIKICKSKGAEIVRGRAEKIETEDGRAVGVFCGGKFYEAKNVVLASGGKSYPKTGSDGGGYALAEALGHTVADLQPSLVPINIEERFCERLSGLSLKNITLSLYGSDKPKKPLYSELGELCFTDAGIGGPLALTASCLIDERKISCNAYMLYIDFKPALSYEQLDSRILRDISSSPSAPLGELLRGLLPRPAAELFADILGLSGSAPASNLKKQNRAALVSLLKRFEMTPLSLGSFDEAIITRGGVSVKEIFPNSMESKLVKGLYFAGEIIDCDGFTGGYNLTIAFSTAFCAAEDIINKNDKDVEKWD